MRKVKVLNRGTKKNVIIGWHHGTNFAKGVAIVEYEDGTMHEIVLPSIQFISNPEATHLTQITTELCAGMMAAGLGKGSQILFVEAAVKMAKEIILQTK